VKTRSGAARLIADGKVRINGERIQKPSRLVHDGDVVTAANQGRLTIARHRLCGASRANKHRADSVRGSHTCAEQEAYLRLRLHTLGDHIKAKFVRQPDCCAHSHQRLKIANYRALRRLVLVARLL
jgi:ribosomal 50S subunit-recycling heat shock protein